MNKNIRNIVLLLTASTSLAACSHMPSWMGGRVEEKPKLAGERKVALELDSQLKVDESLKNKPPVLPAVTANADWAQNNGLFTAAKGNLSGGKFDIKNSARAGDGNDFSHSLVPRPVVAGGIVFAMDSAGIISAHDATDISKVKWVSNVVADADEHEVIGGGLAVDSGVLYATTGQGQVAAISTVNGKQLWKKSFSIPLRGSPRASGTRVVVMTIDSRTYTLSTKTGDILWEHRGINETAAVMNSVSPTIAGDDVLVPYSSGELFSLSLADGKELWSDTLLQNKYRPSMVFTGIGADPVVDGSVAFVASNNGLTTAISIPQGKRVWQQQAGALNSPWLAGDELFLLTSDNELVDFVKYTGKIRWTKALASYEDPESKQNPISWRGPVLVDGKLVVVSSNGQMVFVSAATGKIIETKSIPDNIVTAPVVAGGKLYLVGQDATLYSFQ
jgi:outer membrane protein assembly factor BamB